MRNLIDLEFYADVTGPLPIAHQGGDIVGPDKSNTMPAFQAAVDAGFRYIETDTVAGADGYAMAVHGAKSQADADKSLWPLRSVLESLNYKDIRDDSRLHIGGEPIPRLDEVLSSFPDTRFYIDAKTPDSVKPLAEVIKSQQAAGRVSIGAFDARRTKDVVKEVGGKVPIATSIGVFGSFALLGAMAKVPFTKAFLRHNQGVQFPLPHKIKLPLFGPTQVVTPKLVERAHELGLRVIPWTPNDPVDIEKLYAAGADGVISDNAWALLEIAQRYQPTS